MFLLTTLSANFYLVSSCHFLSDVSNGHNASGPLFSAFICLLKNMIKHFKWLCGVCVVASWSTAWLDSGLGGTAHLWCRAIMAPRINLGPVPISVLPVLVYLVWVRRVFRLWSRQKKCTWKDPYVYSKRPKRWARNGVYFAYSTAAILAT